MRDVCGYRDNSAGTSRWITSEFSCIFVFPSSCPSAESGWNRRLGRRSVWLDDSFRPPKKWMNEESKDRKRRGQVDNVPRFVSRATRFISSTATYDHHPSNWKSTGGVRHALWINMSTMKIKVQKIKQNPPDDSEDMNSHKSRILTIGGTSITWHFLPNRIFPYQFDCHLVANSFTNRVTISAKRLVDGSGVMDIRRCCSGFFLYSARIRVTRFGRQCALASPGRATFPHSAMMMKPQEIDKPTKTELLAD